MSKALLLEIKLLIKPIHAVLRVGYVQVARLFDKSSYQHNSKYHILRLDDSKDF